MRRQLDKWDIRAGKAKAVVAQRSFMYERWFWLFLGSALIASKGWAIENAQPVAVETKVSKERQEAFQAGQIHGKLTHEYIARSVKQSKHPESHIAGLQAGANIVDVLTHKSASVLSMQPHEAFAQGVKIGAEASKKLHEAAENVPDKHAFVQGIVVGSKVTTDAFHALTYSKHPEEHAAGVKDGQENPDQLGLNSSTKTAFIAEKVRSIPHGVSVAINHAIHVIQKSVEQALNASQQVLSEEVRQIKNVSSGAWEKSKSVTKKTVMRAGRLIVQEEKKATQAALSFWGKTKIWCADFWMGVKKLFG